MAFGDSSLRAMMEVYHSMHTYMGYSFVDIGMMTPIERDVLMSIFIRDKKQEASKKQGI